MKKIQYDIRRAMRDEGKMVQWEIGGTDSEQGHVQYHPCELT